MSINHQVFTGIFSDELGQRFLMMMGEVLDNAFYDLFQTCVPNNIKRLKECLMKVGNWDKSILNAECEKISYVDYENLFKQSYINYVKQMKGSNQVKISVNMPKFENFIYYFLVNASKHKFLSDGRYFECGPLEQKCVCMAISRNTLYEFLGDEYVKIEQKRASSVISSQSVRSKYKHKEPPIQEELSDEDSIAPEDSVSQLGYTYNRENRRDDRRDDRRNDRRDDRRDDRRYDRRDDRRDDDERRKDDKMSDTNHERKRDNDELSLSSVTLSQTRRELKRMESDNISESSYREREDRRMADDNISEYSSRDKREDDKFSESSYRGDKREDDKFSESSFRGDKYSSVSKRSKRDVPQMLRNEDEDSSSSEEENKNDSKKKSPCKSYVTQLTDVSRMTSER